MTLGHANLLPEAAATLGSASQSIRDAKILIADDDGRLIGLRPR